MRRKSWHSQSAPAAVASSLPLFDQTSSIEVPPGSLNDDFLVRGAIYGSIKRSKLSREEIAERMQTSLNVRVTARMITSFTAESKELHRWPGAWTRAFCQAVGDDALLRCCPEAAGYRLIHGADIQLLELGREYLRGERAEERKLLLKQQLREVEL